MLAAALFTAATANQDLLHNMFQRIIKDKTRDPQACILQMFENYATIQSCAQRTCTCSGGTWGNEAPYCTGEQISCAAAQQCIPIGNACLKAAAPDCEVYFEQACQEATAAAGCSSAVCAVNVTAAPVRRLRVSAAVRAAAAFGKKAVAAKGHPAVTMLRKVVGDKTRDPEACLLQMFENYATIQSCAQRTCTCSGGTWGNEAPYCTGEQISCAAAQQCIPIGNACLKAAAPDCEVYFEQACQEATAAAGCSSAVCAVNITAGKPVVQGKKLRVSAAVRAKAATAKSSLASALVRKVFVGAKAAANPEACLLEMFENYATIQSCAQRTCTCSGGTWGNEAPYCTGEQISCVAAQKCVPIGNSCLNAVAPDCEVYFQQTCQEAATLAGCDASTCAVNATRVH